ncbi:MAG: hypothetical protein PVI26_09695 [Chitinispirillia bacterium]|jgi:hypothetical protein
MNRWYDKDKTLRALLDSLKPMKKKQRDEICTAIIELIKENQSELIDEMVMEFPLELHQRRWYDKDPYLWLIFNGLSKASDELLEKVKKYLKKKVKLK